MALCVCHLAGEGNENWPMKRDLRQWQCVGRRISWCRHLVYLHRLSSCRKRWPAIGDLSHLTLMNQGELLWQRMAYLIPAHLRHWPQPSHYALGPSAPPTKGQSNSWYIRFLWKQRERGEKWEKDRLVVRRGGKGGRFRLVVIRSTWSEMLILKRRRWKVGAAAPAR